MKHIRFVEILPTALIALFLFASQSHAIRWSNNFVEFQLPSNWDCVLEGAEWVCQHKDQARMKDAIIILAAKLKGEQDSLESYHRYLEKPKYYESIDRKPVKSTPKWTKFEKYNDQSWVDSMHLESEIPGFYTRYLATVKEDIGILVTYSVNKDRYQQYREPFEEMVKTLKAFRKPGEGINVNPNSGANIFGGASRITTLFGGGGVATTPTQTDSDEGDEGGEDSAKKSSSGEMGDELVIALVVLALIILVIVRRRRQG